MSAKIDEAQMVRTARTLMRQWRASDLEPFGRLNADPEVMRFFLSPLSRVESDALAARLADHVARHGFGFWALEIPGVTDFAGFVGLVHAPIDAPFTPAIELGWRLDRPYWGCGYASEAALGAVRFAFDALELSEVVAYAALCNVRSRAVMTRIGMAHDPDDDFDHPRVPAGHPLQRHVLYRVARPKAVADR